jgi:hypothetical protein
MAGVLRHRFIRVKMAKALIRLICLLAALSVINSTPVPDVAVDDQPDEFDTMKLSNDFYQGDIFLTEEQKIELFGTQEEIGEYTGHTSENRRWPKNSSGQVIVPYQFRSTDAFSE